MYSSTILTVLLFTVNASAISIDKRVNDEHVCVEHKATQALSKLQVSPRDVKFRDFEDLCSDKNLCFSMDTQKPIKIDGYQIPANSEIKYCLIEGLRSIRTVEEKVVSKGDLNCTGGISFQGSPSQACDCGLAKPLQVNIGGKDKYSNFTIPAGASVAFTDSRVSHFILDKALNFSGKKFSKDIVYKIDESGINPDSREAFAKCNSRRSPNEGDLEGILSKYRIKKSDLAEITFSDSCSNSSSELPEKAINVSVGKNILTSDFNIPRGADIEFCNGELKRIDSRPSNLIEVLGRNCTVKVEYIAESKKYYCQSYDDLRIDGVDVPAGVSIVFNREKIFCFGVYNSNDPDSSNIPVVAGVKLKGSSYQIRNGKPVPSDCK